MHTFLRGFRDAGVGHGKSVRDLDPVRVHPGNEIDHRAEGGTSWVNDRGQRHHDSRGVTSGGGRVLIEDGEWWIFLRSRNFTSSPGDGDDVRCPIGLGKRVIADTWRTRIGGEEAV